MTSRTATFTAALVTLTSVILWSFAGCSLRSSGLSDPEGKACDAQAQCSDDNPCTADACDQGFCKNDPVPDGDSPEQVAGDCLKVTCAGGVKAVVGDETDVVTDNNDCTDDKCVNGATTHANKSDGSTCTLADSSGTCAAGVCEIKCDSTTLCDDKNVCTTDACDLSRSICVFTPLDGTPTPGVTQTQGDCHVQLCLAGVDSDVADDSDLPAVMNDCYQAVCDNGAPSTPFRPKDAFCKSSGGRYCDGAGTCVFCTNASQCPLGANECQAPSCQTTSCSLTNVANNTPTMTQTSGDCRLSVCDGAGNIKLNPDNTDPQNDGNSCTTDTCKADGTTTHTDKPAGTICGDMVACIAGGQCSGCVMDSQCTAPETCAGGGVTGVCGCTKTTCAAQNKTCGSIPDGCGGTLNCNTTTRNGNETDVDCGGNTATCPTRCTQGKKCSAGTDCSSGFCVDGVCCNAACSGSCSACIAAKTGDADGTCRPIPAGQDPENECATQAQTSCGTTGFCDGSGACQKYAAGTECAAASCQTGTNVLNKADTCNGSGTCVDNGTQSCGNFDCSGIACLTTCGSDTDCISTAFCSGSTCFAKKPPGQSCGGDNECISSHCVDGLCCNTACSTCQACNLPGSKGTCANIGAGQPDNDPAGACAECDGMGACFKSNGDACTTGSECSSGRCVDSVCCDTTCTETCKSCNLTGTKGTCSFIPLGGTDASPLCGGMTDACNGSGLCLLKNGQPCTMGSECASGNCSGMGKCN